MPDFGPLISARELADELDQNDLVIVDCRFDLGDPAAGRRLWLDSHIPGAAFLDLELDLSAPAGAATGRHPLPAADDLTKAFRRCGINKRSRVVVYDAWHGGIAARAWWLLTALGHDSVAQLERGILGWKNDGLAFEQGPGRVVAAGDFHGSPERLRRAVVDTEEVEAWLESPAGRCLVDARERERYLGRHEPIDARAGRVPGALNLPFLELMGPDGKFHDKRALRERFDAVLKDAAERAWIAMCGSGVTACHLALAADYAGVARPRIYVGSYSEWISDPDRPVHSG